MKSTVIIKGNKLEEAYIGRILSRNFAIYFAPALSIARKFNIIMLD